MAFREVLPLKPFYLVYYIIIYYYLREPSHMVFLFQNTDYALLVILPKSKEPGSLDEILENLPKNNIIELTKGLVMKAAFVTMPCFYSSNITSLKTILQEV